MESHVKGFATCHMEPMNLNAKLHLLNWFCTLGDVML